MQKYCKFVLKEVNKKLPDSFSWSRQDLARQVPVDCLTFPYIQTCYSGIKRGDIDAILVRNKSFA